jgi:hypothetical protein
MATGRLGTTVPAATTLTTVYTVPSSNYSVFNVSFTNTNATAVTIRLAIASLATPVASEYIEYDTTIIAKGVFERTGIVAQGGLQVVVYCSSAAVNVNVYGIETSTA